MSNELAFSFMLGASIGGSFNTAIGTATGRVKRLGESIRSIKGDATYKAAEQFLRLRDKVRESRTELKQAEARLAALRQEAEASGGAGALLAKRIELADKRVQQLQGSTKRASTAFVHNRVRMQDQGVSLRGLVQNYNKATRAVDNQAKAQERLGKVLQQRKALQAQRADYRGQIGDMAALGATLAGPVLSAVGEEQAQIRLSTVLNADDKSRAMADARQFAHEVAMSGLAARDDVYNTLYSMNSAGLESGAARSASAVALKVAKLTGGMGESVGEVIATTYNNLGKSIQGSTDEKMQRIGDLLTKTQFKFQIRDFSQLGESLKEGAAGLANYNVNMEQGVMLLGQMNNAGLQGGRAGTALNAVLRQLGKAQKEWGIEIVRGADGQLDMISTLEQLDEALAGMSQDERAQALQDVFGDEGAKGVVPLLENLKSLRPALRDVADGSRGIVDAEIGKFLQSSLGQWERTKNTVSVLGGVIGGTLLPGVNALFGGVSAVLGPLAVFAAEHETLTTVIGGAIAGFVAFRVAMFAGGYAMTFVREGLLQLRALPGDVGGAIRKLGAGFKWLSNHLSLTALKTTALGAAQKAWAIGSAIVTGATTAISTAFRVMGAAIMSNPIGLIIGGIALAAGYMIAHWQPARDFFVGVFDAIGSKLSWLWDKISGFVGGTVKMIGTLLDPLGLVGDALNWLFGDDADKEVKVSGDVAAPAASASSGDWDTISRAAAPAGLPAQASSGSLDLTLNQTFHIQGGDPATLKCTLSESTGDFKLAVRRALDELLAEDRRLRLA